MCEPSSDDTEAYAERSGIRPVAAGDLTQLLERNTAIETTKLLTLSNNIPLLSDLLDKLSHRYPDTGPVLDPVGGILCGGPPILRPIRGKRCATWRKSC